MISHAFFHSPPPIERFRTLLLADADLQDRLASIEDRNRFLSAAAETAATNGIVLDIAQLDEALRPDPLGLDRFGATPATRGGWPARHWLPTAIVPGMDEPAIDWTHFGGERLTEPFYEESARRAKWRPLNQLLRRRTPLATLASDAPDVGLRAPTGLIFHMSRCGSTLVAQMLAAIPTSTIVSEAPVLDAVVGIAQAQTAIPDAERIAMLRAVVGALGRDRHDARGPFVIKLDSWHSLALPLFRRAFPRTPWIFLYRDPLEVMVSQQRMRGLQTIAGAIGEPYDIAGGARMSAELHTAHVLAMVCEAALAHRGLGGGLFVDYARLPDAVESVILPHFGIVPDAQQTAAMRLAATRDAKAPGFAFASDAEQKRSTASDTVRTTVDAVLADVHRRLDDTQRESGA